MIEDLLPSNRINKSIVIIIFKGPLVSIYQGSTKYIARKKNMLSKKQAYTVMYESYVKRDSNYSSHFAKAIAGHCINLNTSKAGPYRVIDKSILIQLHAMCHATAHCKHTLVSCISPISLFALIL
ncbi:ORF24 [Xestia c-nigrum granulovirus]|uniref:ORF24 n=1 Tax=Xestia c-nigrum granulosis virus TaxID=51677 RepID=Q9PZ19_GVXN|nr:ORF24 [Xestia c-nigrum granulovirus]AAF05138.1 ORF24 [Xestia c-nigrum granulovirus]